MTVAGLDDWMRCSFCGKHHQQVQKLIAGPGVFICNECVGLCQDILNEPGTPPAPAFTLEQEERIREIVADRQLGVPSQLISKAIHAASAAFVIGAIATIVVDPDNGTTKMAAAEKANGGRA